jgi:hydroxymethylbilane synthase
VRESSGRPPDRITLATRGSPLARAQTQRVVDRLEAAHAGLEISVVRVTTTGDVDSRPFRDIGGKGLFAAEVERAVLQGRADVAVHSAKDLTAELAPGAVVLCVPERASPADVVVGGLGTSGEERLGSLPTGAVVGTSSARRRALILEARPDLEVTDLRGNLGTRLDRVAGGDIDAAVVAAAGLARLPSRSLPPWSPLDPDRWVPAPGQGALAVEGLAVRGDLVALFQPLEDPEARAELTCERAFARRLEGGCSVPLGCRARATSGGLVVTGYVGSLDGTASVRDRTSGPLGSATTLGIELAEALLSAGADDILAEVEEDTVPEVGPP